VENEESGGSGGQRRTSEAIFFFNSAFSLASAFASFFAVSCSSLACASKLIVPNLAARPSIYANSDHAFEETHNCKVDGWRCEFEII